MNLIDTYVATYNPDIVGVKYFQAATLSIVMQDQEDGYGGVFITCQVSLNSCSLDIVNNFCEIVACKIS